MINYGVIGYPLDHSFSPQIHNTALEYYGFNSEYLKVEITENNFNQTIQKLKREEWGGFNVTIPYKKKIIPYLDELDPLCERIGAVNTIQIVRKGYWKGYNTDYRGFLNPIDKVLSQLNSCFIIGAGGATHAIGFGLLEFSNINHIVLVNRTLSRGKELLNKFKNYKLIKYELYELGQIVNLNKKFDIIINTTSIGMGNQTGRVPLDPTLFSSEKTIVYDLIYNPSKTEFLKKAESKNLHTINGLQMLIGQAAESFKIWTGKSFPDEILSKLDFQLVN